MHAFVNSIHQCNSLKKNVCNTELIMAKCFRQSSRIFDSVLFGKICLVLYQFLSNRQITSRRSFDQPDATISVMSLGFFFLQ